MIKIAVCDDNLEIAAMITDFIETELDKLQYEKAVCKFSDERKFVSELHHEIYDVVFLDYQMPSMTGFEVAKKIRRFSLETFIVFVTALDDMVYESFEYQPCDFVRKSLKNLFIQRLSVSLNRALTNLKPKGVVTLNAGRDDESSIRLSDIVYIESYAHYLKYWLVNNEIKSVRGKIEEIESEYKKSNFIRIHKSYIVNMEHIVSTDKSTVEMFLDNSQIGIGRKYKEDFFVTYKMYRRSKL